MTNHRGVNGLQHRPGDRYRPTLAELRARGRSGGTKAGQIRHSSAKWRAVQAAVDASKGGALSWQLLADFYDATYDAGYGACYNNQRRKVKAAESAA